MPTAALLEKEALLPDALVRLRDRYPAAKCLRSEWDDIKKLVKQGKDDEAEARVKACMTTTRVRVLNKIAVSHRLKRREYLKMQRDMEAGIKADLEAFSDKLASWLSNAAGSDGTVPYAALNRILNMASKFNVKTWAAVLNRMKAGIRDAVWYGIVVTMQSAQDGLDLLKKLQSKESVEAWAVSEAEQKAILAKTSVTFKTIFDRVTKRMISQKLFTNRPGGVARSGISLSRRVWDLRDAHLRRLRAIIAAGIAAGRPATAIASDIKAMTHVGQISTAGRASSEPGRGVYKSAYKNALRVARTETNNAYVDAEMEYAKHKGYSKMWNVSVGHRFSDSCDDLAGRIFGPDEMEDLANLYPQHPACACFLTTVLPDIG